MSSWQGRSPCSTEPVIQVRPELSQQRRQRASIERRGADLCGGELQAARCYGRTFCALPGGADENGSPIRSACNRPPL